MNMATMALEEAYYNEEKTVTAGISYNSDWFNEFKRNGDTCEGTPVPRG